MTKKNIIFLSVSLILIILLGIGVSYSMWNISVSQDTNNTAYTECFDLSITNKENNINLDNAYPISNDKGKSLTPYTFTVTNESDATIPLYFTLNQGINTFENLYFKIIDSNNNVVMPATHLLDDRYEIDTTTGKYLKDSDGNMIKKANFESLTMSPIVLTGINKDLEGTTDP